MKETYKCPHGTSEALIGSDHECYCNQCKSIIYSEEETIKQEMSLNKDKQK